MVDGDKSIRILIVDDNEETRIGIQRFLDYETDIEIIDFAEDGEEAITKVHEQKPDVVLMDINMRGLNGIEATQRLRDTAPRTKVVIVSVQDDPNYMRSAMRAGAVDFLAKPPRPDDLIQAIRRAYSMIPPEPVGGVPQQTKAAPAASAPSQPGQSPSFFTEEKDGKVVSLMGLKGGVGKTTLAVSLAVGLARSAKDKTVVLVDTNTYSGDVHIFLNTRGQYSVVDTAFMAQESELDAQGLDGVLVPHDSGIKLILAPRNPIEAEPLSSSGLEALIDDLRKQFDYIILDTASNIDESLLAVVRISDYIIAVTQAIMPALKDSQVLLSMLRELGVMDDAPDPEMGEVESDKVILALNHYTDSSSISPERIGDFLKQPVTVQIAADPGAMEAINKSMPLIMGDPRQYPAVEGLKNLIKVVRARVEKIEAAAPADQGETSGWWPFGRRSRG
ncbi:MAG: response regulator [Anaerolineae bacterium]